MYDKEYYHANKHKYGYLGVGSGPKSGTDNPAYKTGRCTFRRWAREKLQATPYCERCSKHIDTTQRKSWAGHHKDHNPSNNILDNLEVLCKQCHQIEHECWKAFSADKL